MSEKYTFLFAPLDGVGHVNACLGIAEQLRDRGHRVVFATPMSWKGKLEQQGFIEELYHVSDEELNPSQSGAAWWESIMAKMRPAVSGPSIEIHEKIQIPIWNETLNQIKYSDRRLREIVSNVKPDAIVVDYMLHIPALMDQGKLRKLIEKPRFIFIILYFPQFHQAFLGFYRLPSLPLEFQM
jgi:UDP:flavonoid glycosyltransferase YjiC (YdhE family)